MKIRAKLIICFSSICIGCMLISMLSVLAKTHQRCENSGGVLCRFDPGMV